MTHNDLIIAAIIKSIDESIQKETESIVLGLCKNHKEYRRRTGKIAGLNLAKFLIDDTMKRLLEDDDVDD